MKKTYENFEFMTNDELQNTDGGIGPVTIFGIIGTAFTLYMGLREIVRDKGFNDAIKGK